MLLSEGADWAYQTSVSQAISVAGACVIVPLMALKVTMSCRAVRLALIRMLALVEVSEILPSPFTPGGVMLPASTGCVTTKSPTVVALKSPVWT